ncbi:unnamed protein product, partial [Mesorhabditis belari]|uniref:Uncharacterized protein n=1 Tax=Mesorhabditis belari TaxID=2138241 RepID=A0AAF3F0Q1_9BILA
MNRVIFVFLATSAAAFASELNECEAARDEHNKMNQLLAEKAAAEDNAFRKKPLPATELTGKRKEKCDKNKAAKLQHRACLRDSRQQRSKCVALAKCCQPVKQCQNDTTFKSKIVALRKTTKEKTKACRQATQKRAQATRVKKAKKANKGKKNKQNKNETSTVPAKNSLNKWKE